MTMVGQVYKTTSSGTVTNANFPYKKTRVNTFTDLKKLYFGVLPPEYEITNQYFSPPEQASGQMLISDILRTKIDEIWKALAGASIAYSRGDELETLDLDTRLIPPPLGLRRVRVRFRLIGREVPRVPYNPATD